MVVQASSNKEIHVMSLSSWLRNGRTARRAAKPRTNYRLRVEALEERIVPAYEAYQIGDVLTITGTSSHETTQVNIMEDRQGTIAVSGTGADRALTFTGVAKIEVTAEAGPLTTRFQYGAPSAVPPPVDPSAVPPADLSYTFAAAAAGDSAGSDSVAVTTYYAAWWVRPTPWEINIKGGARNLATSCTLVGPAANVDLQEQLGKKQNSADVAIIAITPPFTAPTVQMNFFSGQGTPGPEQRAAVHALIGLLTSGSPRATWDSPLALSLHNGGRHNRLDTTYQNVAIAAPQTIACACPADSSNSVALRFQNVVVNAPVFVSYGLPGWLFDSSGDTSTTTSSNPVSTVSMTLPFTDTPMDGFLQMHNSRSATGDDIRVTYGFHPQLEMSGIPQGMHGSLQMFVPQGDPLVVMFEIAPGVS
jgi:hypothetical protein